MIYKFAKNSGFSGDAETVFSELEQIRDINDGQLHTCEIVNAARPAKSPLHPYFEWNDQKAAEKYRENTARRLVRAIIIKPEKDTPEDNPAIHRAYISVKPETETPTDRTRYYQNINEASQDEFDSAIDQFKSKLSQLKISLGQIERHAKTDNQIMLANNLNEKTRQIEYEFNKGTQEAPCHL